MPASLRFVVEGTPSYLEGYTIYTNALQLMVDQKRALVADDWDELIRLADQGIGQAHGASSAMGRTVGLLSSMVTAVNKEFADMLAAQAEAAETREEYFAKVKDVIATDPQVSDELLEGVDAFAEGTVTGNPLYELLTSGWPEVEDSEKVASAIDATVALAVRSLMALTFANFQRHHETLAGMDFQPAGEAFGEALEEPVRLFGEELDASVQALHSEVAAGSPPGPPARSLMHMLEDSLPRFGRVQATIRRYAVHLRDEGKGTASEAAGRLSAEAADLTRAAFASYAAGYYLALQYNAVPRAGDVEELIENAARLPYDARVPQGKKTEISKVDELADGDYVRVAGFVDSVAVGKDDDGKLITQVVLRDPSSDASVVAAGIFVHLVHNGLAQDAYCMLSGDWQSASGLNHGDPAIQIQKLAVKELASKSWRIAFERAASRFVDRWPANLNMQFGLSPHESGEEEGASKVMGAGELIYGPMIG